MAKIGRNDPCPCGSAKKAKRCCFSSERLVAEADVCRCLDDLSRQVLGDLDGIDRADIDALFYEAIHLPGLDLSLQVRLPALSSPAVERARAALDDDDTEAFDDALREVVEQLDTPERRLDLARAIVAFKEAGRIDPKVAAVAIFDLNDRSGSDVLLSSIAESIGVSAGDTRTPAGLFVVAA